MLFRVLGVVTCTLKRIIFNRFLDLDVTEININFEINIKEYRNMKIKKENAKTCIGMARQGWCMKAKVNLLKTNVLGKSPNTQTMNSWRLPKLLTDQLGFQVWFQLGFQVCRNTALSTTLIWSTVLTIPVWQQYLVTMVYKTELIGSSWMSWANLSYHWLLLYSSDVFWLLRERHYYSCFLESLRIYASFFILKYSSCAVGAW